MLNVAIISGWHVHADGYANELSRFPGVKLTAMYDEDTARGKAFAAKYSMDFEPDLDKLLSRADVDAVCVNAPTNTHRDVMVKAAEAKKHIFTEKVLAAAVAEAADIKAAVEKNNVKFCISFPHRTFPHNLFAKKVLDAGLLGKVTLMRVRNAHNGASAGWLPPHFYDEKQCAGGAMMDLGAHPMYLIHWLMGRPVSVSSVFTAVTGHEVEDNAVSLLRFGNGAIAVSETGFVSGASPFSMELYGTDGSLLIGKDGISLCPNNRNGEFGGWVTPEQLPAPLPGPIEQFVKGVTENETIYFGIGDAFALTEIMEAAYRSHREKREINM